jgi:hypothetical protein
MTGTIKQNLSAARLMTDRPAILKQSSKQSLLVTI